MEALLECNATPTSPDGRKRIFDTPPRRTVLMEVLGSGMTFNESEAGDTTDGEDLFGVGVDSARSARSCGDLVDLGGEGCPGDGADEDEALLFVSQLRRVERGLRNARGDPGSALDAADALARISAAMARTPLARAARARSRRAGRRRKPARREREFTAVFTEEDDARDLARRRRARRRNGALPWSLTRRPDRPDRSAEATPASSPTPAAAPFLRLPRAVHPNSAFKRRWDSLTSLLAVFVVFAPEARALAGYSLGFEEPAAPAAGRNPFAAVVNLWFLLDVLLNFVTGYVTHRGVLVMSKRRIAIRYCQTYFLLDIWCALPFDRFFLPYVLPDTVDRLLMPAPKARYCASGSVEGPLVACAPRRGPIWLTRTIARHVRVLLPRTLQFAKRRGRLRQVLVSAPNIVQLIVRFFRLLRASRVRLVKWRTLAVLGRRYRKSARAFWLKICGRARAEDERRERRPADPATAEEEVQAVHRERRRDLHRALRKRLSARPKHMRSFSE